MFDQPPIVVPKSGKSNATEVFRRWQVWLTAHGITVPTAEDFLHYGRLSTLERLARAIDHAPEQGGALRAALKVRRREKKAKAGPQGHGGRRGPLQTYSVDEADLPADWRAILDDWRQSRRHIDVGGIHLEDRQPPTLDGINEVAYVLRAVAKTCINRGEPVNLSITTLSAWLTAADDRGCRPSGLSLQLGLLQRFLVAYGDQPDLVERLGKMRTVYGRRASVLPKRKEDWVHNNPIGLGEVWAIAEALLERAAAEPAASRQRHKLVREAAALSLPVVAPLRIGDMARYRFGEHLVRTDAGWSLAVVTRKQRHRVERPELWPELTVFLDALITVDAPSGDLWAGYEARIGTPIFTVDFGKTALLADWISDVWSEHVGCGAHIVRTLWHEVAHESDADLTWMALALCGQKDHRTARQYQVRNAQARAMRNGRGILQTARQAAKTHGPV